MTPLDIKLNEHFGGKVVRKDLTKLVKGNAVVPTYVLEYLLGQYCATDNEETIASGLEQVKEILARHFVHRDEAQLIKSTIKENGSHRVIDKISVKLNDREDRYEANFENLGLKRVPVKPIVIREYPKLLSEGVWCILTVGYLYSGTNNNPWIVEQIKPIQVSDIDLNEFISMRQYFTKDEWIDALMHTIGLNPDEFTFRSKLIQLARLVPYVENNYNLIELGPKGTGKSHIYSEMSPHGILISGGEVTKAKLFVNMSTGELGLVGYWDVVAYDEFAGKAKNPDKGLVDIMKNYMSNKQFSRGSNVQGASASMVFVGNTDRTVSYMIKHSDLFESLPKLYHDSAFLDRMHAYLPGWEVQKLRTEMFSSNYGFIVDYLAEILKEQRKIDWTQKYSDYFELSNSMTTRDKTAIIKTYSGLVKIIYPHGIVPENEAKEIMDFAIECRKRVQTQLPIIDPTYDEIDFSYTRINFNELISVNTLEMDQYGATPVQVTENETEEDPVVVKNQPRLVLREGQKTIHDNQQGISYDNLFGAYLIGATEIKLTDPYIRMPHQMRNLMEFGILLSKKKDPQTEITLHLVTDNTEEYYESARDAFEQITFSLESLGIIFTYEFDDNIHDRSIDMDNGWKIVLGRGLDIFQRTGGFYEIDSYLQEKRLCKSCEITFVKK